MKQDYPRAGHRAFMYVLNTPHQVRVHCGISQVLLDDEWVSIAAYLDMLVVERQAEAVQETARLGVELMMEAEE